MTPFEGQSASSILTNDVFTGNNGIANTISAKMEEVTTTLGIGTHTITLTGTVKGNSAPISVTKVVTISGGCN